MLNCRPMPLNEQAMTTTTPTLPTLIMLARVPVLGQVKSRLARHIGQPQALQAHLQLLRHNAAVACATGMRFELHVTGDVSTPWFARFAAELDVPLLSQASGDIGAKMLYASESVSRASARPTTRPTTASIVIGSDCGDLSVEYLQASAALLATAPLVLGPAEDGGYVLIGQREPFPALFADIPWGTHRVAQFTRERAVQAGLALAELPLQWDVDGVADWRRWQNRQGRLTAGG